MIPIAPNWSKFQIYFYPQARLDCGKVASKQAEKDHAECKPWDTLCKLTIRTGASRKDMSAQTEGMCPWKQMRIHGDHWWTTQFTKDDAWVDTGRRQS